MSDLELLEEEKVVFEANILRYYGALASKTQALLTNKRLILLPQNKWDTKLFAKQATVSLENIEKIQTENINQIFLITCTDQSLRISGSSAPLLINQINRAKTSSTAPTTQLYQAEVSITRGLGLSTAGLLIIQDGHIILQTYTGIKALFLPSKSYDVFIPDVTEHSFLQVGNKLSIHTSNMKLSFLGVGAFVCNIVLNLQKNKEELKGTIHHASLHKDNLHIPGAVFLCEENLYFMPQKQSHRSFDKPYFRISLSKIQSMEYTQKGDSETIIIASHEKSWTLSMQNAQFNFSILLQEAAQLIDQLPSKKKLRVQTILRSRIQYKQDHKIVFGYLFLTKEDIFFTPETGSALAIRIPMADIQKIETTLRSITFHAAKNSFLFQSTHKEKIMRVLDTIESIHPPKHIHSPIGNCSLSEISGNAWSAKLTSKDKEHTIPFLKIQCKKEQVRLLLSHLPEEIQLKKGMRLGIDLARQHTRYYFKSRVLSFSRDSQTPIIGAIVSIERPSNIFRHSLRHDFRVPIIQESTLKDVYNDGAPILSELVSTESPVSCIITNISKGGCQLALPHSISKKRSINGMMMEFTLNIEQREYSLQGKCIYSTANPRNPKEHLYGVAFGSLDQNLEEKLEQYIQNFEQVESQNDSQGTLNPMLRSAMILTKNPAFSNLSLTEAAKFLTSGTNKRFERGKTLIEEGESGDSFFVITSGSVDISKGSNHIATVEKGSAIGELALIDPAPRNATVKAKTDGTWVEITKADFEISIAQGNQTSIKVLQSLSETVLKRLLSLRSSIQDEADKGESASIESILNKQDIPDG